MVKKIRGWYDSLDEFNQALVKSAGQVLVAFVLIALLIAVCIGCTKKAAPVAPVKPTAGAPVDADGYALDPGFEPDFVCLRPGQSAEILEDVEVRARIPFRGDERELWVGRVVLPKGSMAVKPLVEER